MNKFAPSNTAAARIEHAGFPDDRRPRLLIVDDSRLQRRLVVSSMSRSGYDLIEADNAEEALEICRLTPPDMILSDWLMPGLNGIEFCAEVRKLASDFYIYFIILTSKNEKGALAYALAHGADDFVSKPVSPEELRGRISAGMRMITIERELVAKNRLISQTLHRTNELHRALERDLVEARKLQSSLLPRGTISFQGGEIDVLFRPSDHVGGDLVGTFQIRPGHVGIFALDVSGHGISSALITARLSAWLSGTTPEQNLALDRRGDEIVMRSPAEICRTLNEMFRAEIDTEHYFTIVIADVDLVERVAHICQAGHPHPLLIRTDGTARFLGSGGLPIGLLPDATYDQFEVRFDPGDRLLFYSDGLTECPLVGGGFLGEEGLVDIVVAHRNETGAQLIRSFKAEIDRITEDEGPRDDVSAALLSITR